ncbi:FKBP-type peptidyl-prolyl cis-trans isomerase [Lutimonas halocynthiae]|uniref:FKBP-type peptidyl-prolyl cis-trans isomerase n=1 Tax=Lutimonas halocynthiae TaxID=1446477 RepID=UPI0025B31539|nr:FKBP-type peptidyl-prolyl cis-trans isomerase [Lutimonas halocynthiae]MDN3644017.1 FKBP-type peptidyl-prolyl cis-trans isomerase [Lutimonas halocynthiae]
MKPFFIAFFVLLFISCNDDEESISVDYKAENEREIQEYIRQNNLDAKATGSGLHYVVDEQGEGTEITITSDVSLRYKGMLTDGKVLLENNEEGVSINLQSEITGLVEGLQFFNEGGSGMLLIPAHLAYGSNDYGEIPAGSVIIFEVELIDYVAENKSEILAYVSDNDLQAVQSDSGLFYVIDEQGDGDFPLETSTVTVAYKGYFTNGDVFDESDENGITTQLNNFIPGWIEGLQFFKEGGKGKLLIPSSLAYGRFGSQNIPGGSVLVFEVNLVSVN